MKNLIIYILIIAFVYALVISVKTYVELKQEIKELRDGK